MRNPTLTFCKTYMSATLPCLLALALSLLVTPASTSAETTTPPTSEQLDEMFLAGPTAIGSIGMRTVWQSKVTLQGNESAKTLFVTGGDSVFVEDSGCHMSRVLITDGRSLWKNACGRVTDKVRGVNRVMIGNLDVVYITLDHALVGLDAATGALARANKLTRFPLTSSVAYGKHLIFGSKGGQVVWQQYVIGYFWMANELGGIIDQPPILIQSDDGATIAAASSSGQVALLDADTTRQIWRKTLGGAIKGTLGVGANAVYAACEDRSISALEVTNGNLRWRYQTTQPLSSDVFCDGELVYLQVTGEGLLALQAKPLADDATFSRDGVMKWKCMVAGKPLCKVGSRILLWDLASHTLTTVETSNGIVVAAITLPKVAQVAVTGPLDPDMFLMNTDGTVQRCEAIVRTNSAEPTKIAP
jgi:hypothetical protein